MEIKGITERIGVMKIKIQEIIEEEGSTRKIWNEISTHKTKRSVR